MKQTLTTPVVIGLVAAAILIVVGGGWYLTRDQTVTLKPGVATAMKKAGTFRKAAVSIAGATPGQASAPGGN